jgi:hypothetical protein
MRRVLDLERKVATLGADNAGAAEETGNGRGVEGRGHDDEAQVGAGRALEPPQKRERQIAFEMALVKLVEDHTGDSVETRVGEEAAGEDALRQKAEARAGSGDLLETDLIADGLAGALSALGGDEAGGQSGGEASRLEDEDVAGGEVQERGGNAGSLPCPRRRFEDEGRVVAKVADDLGDERVDGQRQVPFSATAGAWLLDTE